MRRLLLILTIASAVLLLGVAGLLAYTNYRCQTDTRYRPNVETTIAGSNWEFYGAPGGLGLTIKHTSEPKQVTEAMTVEQWKAWSLGAMEIEKLHQFAGFSLLVHGTLFRSDLDHTTKMLTAHDIGWWRAVFVPLWVALAIPALLPLVVLGRWVARKRAKSQAEFPVAATAT